MARSRFRSVRYDLDAAVSVAVIVDRAGGATGRDVLARALGYSGTNNGAFLSRLAAARLFGVVGGHGKRVELTELGRRILGSGADAAAARREALLSVPLFAAVCRWMGDAPLPDVGELAALLHEQFGEPASKAPAVAVKLVDSARQAGIAPGSGVFTIFTPVENGGFNYALPRVGSAGDGPEFPSNRRAKGADVDEERGLWLEDEPDLVPAGRSSTWRRAGVIVAVAACIAAIGVPVALVATGNGKSPSAVGKGQAEHRVLAALSSTTDSGSFNFTYTLSSTPPTSEKLTTTTNMTCIKRASEDPASPLLGCHTYSAPPPEADLSGGGTIDTNPLAMMATATIDGGSLQVTVRVDSTTVYEDSGGLETDLSPPPSMANATGQILSDFAGLTDGTLGPRSGPVAMMGMASPTGYLDLVQSDITGASQIGTGTVNGVPVTIYRVSEDPSQLVNAPGVSSVESKTISDALNALRQQGYTGSTVDLSIDSSGYILESKSVDTFSDGGTTILDATFSNFGCAGTVLMPGQQGSGQPPSGCTSPNAAGHANTATQTTNTTVPTTLPPTTVPPGEGTTIPPTTETTPTVPPTTDTVPTTTTPVEAPPSTTSTTATSSS